MATFLEKAKAVTKKQNTLSGDEFDNYIKRQRVKTTFNGLEVEKFSWYKKVLGLL